MARHEELGEAFIRALNDFQRKGNVNIRMSGGREAHPSIIVDRNDDNILIESPTTIHMSHKQFVELDEKIDKIGRNKSAHGRHVWEVIRLYVNIINDSTNSKRIHDLTPKQSVQFMRELWERMVIIIGDGGYDTDNYDETFNAIYNAFGDERDAMIIEVITDILDGIETPVNICRTCKYCSNMNGRPGYGQCKICTFVPSISDTTSVLEFQSEFGKHVYASKGVIYTDITTGCEHCDDYVPRPINAGDVIKGFFMGV